LEKENEILMRKRTKVARPISEDVSELSNAITEGLHSQIAKLKEELEAANFQLTEASVIESGLKQQLRDHVAAEGALLHVRAERDTLRKDMDDLRTISEQQYAELTRLQVYILRLLHFVDPPIGRV
jgi:hypothetical protein